MMASQNMIPQKNFTIRSSEEAFCPENPNCFYRVIRGSVYIFITRKNRDGQGNRIFLCQISESERGHAIPPLVYRDLEYQDWRFVITPTTGEAELAEMQFAPTSPLIEKFIEKTAVKNYRTEGFENSLVEFAKREEVKESGIAAKNDRFGDHAVTERRRVIDREFHGETHFAASGNAAYRAMTYACANREMKLLSWKEVVRRSSRDPGPAAIAKASGVICRRVILDADWHKSDCGPLVCMLDGSYVACIPASDGKYRIYKPAVSGGKDSEAVLTGSEARKISPEAFSIGRTLPNRALTFRDLLQFGRKSISRPDLIRFCVLSLVVSLIGLLLPTLNQLIYDEYIHLDAVSPLAQMCQLMLTFMIGNVFFSIVKNLLSFRITSRVGYELQDAAYHRLFHLPQYFFRQYNSADLASRMMNIGPIAVSFANAIVITGFSTLFSLVYLFRIFSDSPELSRKGLGMYVLYLAIVVWINAMAHKGEERIQESSADASSRLYQYLNGVDKIRMAGVEERAAISYMRPFTRQQRESIRVNRLYSLEGILSSSISFLFSMVFYWSIVRSKVNVSIGSFVAFTTAFGALTGALNSLVQEGIGLMRTRAAWKRSSPLLYTAPENDGKKEIPGELSGDIKLEHVSFSYAAHGRLIVNDMSLDIRDGEYVGIVGSSGCGKSTLLKLLLGFENPTEGNIFIGGRNLAAMDKEAYRRQLGVVLQNGGLISGSIYDNITITAPDASIERVNQVIEQVGLKEDIEKMPMGLQTVLSETSNTISGGQMQRILIARAIIGKPKILIFDEATSALDNITQKTVSDNLDKMKVTRIVVAHRLSTVINCDRILVLNNGKIIEQGKYEDLMARHGFFYQLANRQIVE